MRGFSVGVFFSILILSASCDGQVEQVIPGADSPITCSTEGVECDRNQDNLIDAVMHVMTLEECRQMCLDDDICQFITFVDDSAAPISHLCQMFKTCESQNVCSNCVSENMACFRSCSSNVVGDLDENVQDLLTNIESEQECKESCLNVSSCNFYTYFFANDTLFEKYCVLHRRNFCLLHNLATAASVALWTAPTPAASS